MLASGRSTYAQDPFPSIQCAVTPCGMEPDVCHETEVENSYSWLLMNRREIYSDGFVFIFEHGEQYRVTLQKFV